MDNRRLDRDINLGYFNRKEEETIDIEEIKKEKKILEDEIYKLLTDFTTKTKVLPSSVHLDLMSVETIGDTHHYHYHLNRVRIDAAV